ESERLAFLEFQIVHMGLRSDLDALLLHELLVSLAEQRFKGFLADGFPKLFSDHGRRRLAGSETGQPDSGGVASRRLFFGVLYRLNRHRHLDVSLDPFG